MSCVDEDTILALFDGQLSAADLVRVETHLDTCPPCRRWVADVARSGRGGPAEPNDDAVGPGTRIGRYTVVRWLGSGTTSTVYGVRDDALTREVALKLIRPSPDGVAGTDVLVGAEAKALARLRHPNVLTVHEVGRWRGRAFLVTELVEGRSLREWLDEERPRWNVVLATLIEAGRGLEAAHRAGVVHRDFKPENVAMTGDGRPIVMDFGFATLHYTGERLRSGEVLDIAGTPAYIAPEHAEGRAATASSDQYSFCGVAREALTERASTSPPRAVLRALERGSSEDPEARFADMAALLSCLEQAPRVRRRQRLGALIVGVGATAGVAGYGLARTPPDFCAGDPLLAGVWTPEVQTQLEQRLDAGQEPLQRAKWTQARTAAARFVEGWDRTRSDVCAGASGEPAWPTACLELSRIHFEATLEAASAGTIDSVRFADEILGLEPPGRCSGEIDASAWPPDAASRIEVAQTRRSLAHVRAVLEDDDAERAAELAAEALARARRLEFEPVRLEALLEFGRARAALGDPDGLEIIESATGRAEFLRLHRVHGEGLLAQAELARDREDPKAVRWAEAAVVALEPLGPAGALPRARAHNILGGFALSTGAFERALEHVGAATQLYEDADDPRVAKARFNFGSIVQALGRHGQALAIFVEARDEFVRDLGPDHSDTGRAWHSIGSTHNLLEQFDQALPSFERAHEILATALGPDHIDTLKASFGGGNALLALGRVEEALDRYQRCAEVLDGGSPAPLFVFCADSRSKALEELGRIEDARTSWRRAYEVARTSDMGTVPIRATIPFDLARLEFDAGDKLRAIELMLDARTICRQAQWDARELCDQIEGWLHEHAS